MSTIHPFPSPTNIPTKPYLHQMGSNNKRKHTLPSPSQSHKSSIITMITIHPFHSPTNPSKPSLYQMGNNQRKHTSPSPSHHHKTSVVTSARTQLSTKIKELISKYKDEKGELLGYVDTGTELVIDTRKSPSLKDSKNPSDWHNLQAMLHVVAGWNGEKGEFELKVKRSLALVNKCCEFLRDECFVPGSWWVMTAIIYVEFLSFAKK